MHPPEYVFKDNLFTVLSPLAFAWLDVYSRSLLDMFPRQVALHASLAFAWPDVYSHTIRLTYYISKENI